MNVVSKTLNKALFTVFSLVLVFFSFNASADCKNDTLEARIAPVGMACVEGDECKEPVAEVVEVAAVKAARSGSEIYVDYCAGCHQSAGMGAPVVGGTFKALEAKGINKLLATAIKGKNAMPRKGNCSDCSEEELKGTIEYMLKQ